jgi:hypothetical protein
MSISPHSIGLDDDDLVALARIDVAFRANRGQNINIKQHKHESVFVSQTCNKNLHTNAE